MKLWTVSFVPTDAQPPSDPVEFENIDDIRAWVREQLIVDYTLYGVTEAKLALQVTDAADPAAPMLTGTVYITDHGVELEWNDLSAPTTVFARIAQRSTLLRDAHQASENTRAARRALRAAEADEQNRWAELAAFDEKGA